MKKHWFTPKRFGWGVMPISIEGWLLTIALIGLVWLAAYVNNIYTEMVTPQDIIRFVIDAIMLVGLFMVVAERKCNEPITWRWGK